MNLYLPAYDRVGEAEGFGAQKLGFQAQFPGKSLGFGAVVLGIAQNGKAHVGAVEPKLVGSAGDGPQLQFT